mgnify:CR=1 FL=1
MNKTKLEDILKARGIEETNDLVDELTKEISLQTVPKDQFNKMSDRVKALENEKKDIETKFNDFKVQNMTDEEKIKAELKKLESDKMAVARQLSEIAVEKVLSKNGIDSDTYGEEEYKELVNNLISDTTDNSISKANNFVSILAKQKERVEKETTSNLLKNTPNPQVGDGDKKVTKEEFDKMTYSEMMKFMEEEPELYKEYSK